MDRLQTANRQLPTRRDLLFRAGGGLGGVALAWLLGQEGALAGEAAPGLDNPYAPKPSHFPAKAKRVIQIFACGGVSHIDTFDYKPDLKHFVERISSGRPGIYLA